MDSQIRIFFKNWESWLKNEKRLAENTVKSYCIDLKSFLKFIDIHNNSNVDIEILTRLDEDDLSSWFYERLRNGAGHRSNARALSSLKSFFCFLISKNIIGNKIKQL